MAEASERYDATTIALHWTTVVLVLSLWSIGQLADLLPKGPVRSDIWSLHVTLGFALAAVLAWRISWRFNGHRLLPPANSGALQVLAEAVHFGLYLLLFATVALGIANAFVRGYTLFDLTSLPQLGDKNLKEPITDWHGLAANVLVGLAALHAGAALAHHYLLKDRVLLRMLPERRTALDETLESTDR